MQPSLGILPVYCYSTSGVYHAHMHTPTCLYACTQREKKRVCLCVLCTCDTHRDRGRASWCVTDLSKPAQTCRNAATACLSKVTNTELSSRDFCFLSSEMSLHSVHRHKTLQSVCSPQYKEKSIKPKCCLFP